MIDHPSHMLQPNHTLDTCSIHSPENALPTRVPPQNNALRTGLVRVLEKPSHWGLLPSRTSCVSELTIRICGNWKLSYRNGCGLPNSDTTPMHPALQTWQGVPRGEIRHGPNFWYVCCIYTQHTHTHTHIRTCYIYSGLDTSRTKILIGLLYLHATRTHTNVLYISVWTGRVGVTNRSKEYIQNVLNSPCVEVYRA